MKRQIGKMMERDRRKLDYRAGKKEDREKLQNNCGRKKSAQCGVSKCVCFCLCMSVQRQTVSRS